MPLNEFHRCWKCGSDDLAVVVKLGRFNEPDIVACQTCGESGTRSYWDRKWREAAEAGKENKP